MCGEERSTGRRSSSVMEIPPRVRRRGSCPQGARNIQGNTSACAEKRPWPQCSRTGPRKYLRVCGEELRPSSFAAVAMEIPPRVRRRAAEPCGNLCDSGNTSACAEKSKSRHAAAHPSRKYLRVCGEELVSRLPRQVRLEIPPRMRRRVEQGQAHVLALGNTSAYAEKSRIKTPSPSRIRKYLRVCGEERWSKWAMPVGTEIPPRMRRRVDEAHRPMVTSVKYLRVCGEEREPSLSTVMTMEIPPRMRRRGCLNGAAESVGGNTSAYAEKRVRRRRLSELIWKYLRVCGEES